MRSLKILKIWKLMKQVSIPALLYKVKVKTLKVFDKMLWQDLGT